MDHEKEDRTSKADSDGYDDEDIAVCLIEAALDDDDDSNDDRTLLMKRKNWSEEEKERYLQTLREEKLQQCMDLQNGIVCDNRIHVDISRALKETDYGRHIPPSDISSVFVFNSQTFSITSPYRKLNAFPQPWEVDASLAKLVTHCHLTEVIQFANSFKVKSMLHDCFPSYQQLPPPSDLVKPYLYVYSIRTPTLKNLLLSLLYLYSYRDCGFDLTTAQRYQRKRMAEEIELRRGAGKTDPTPYHPIRKPVYLTHKPSSPNLSLPCTCLRLEPGEDPAEVRKSLYRIHYFFLSYNIYSVILLSIYLSLFLSLYIYIYIYLLLSFSFSAPFTFLIP